MSVLRRPIALAAALMMQSPAVAGAQSEPPTLPRQPIQLAPADPGALPDLIPPHVHVPLRHATECRLTQSYHDSPVIPGVPVTALPSHELMRIPSAHDLADGSGVTIAVIDTGVVPHPRLAVSGGGDYLTGGSGLEDCDAHGSIVAALAAAAPDPAGLDRIRGTAPGAQILSIRQSSTHYQRLDRDSGVAAGDTDSLAKAIVTAAQAGAQVINISQAACIPAGQGTDEAALQAAVDFAVTVHDAVIVVAAGNAGSGGCADNSDVDHSYGGLRTWPRPSIYSEQVLTVGAVDDAGVPMAFSLAGPWVDIAAPGVAVVTLDPRSDGLTDALLSDEGPAPLTGTSFAAPQVAGVAALVRQRHPHLSAAEVRELLIRTAAPAQGTPARSGAGIVDAHAALSAPVRHPTEPESGEETAAGPATTGVPAELARDTGPFPTPDSPGAARTVGLISLGGAVVLGGVLAALGAAAQRHRRVGEAEDIPGR